MAGAIRKIPLVAICVLSCAPEHLESADMGLLASPQTLNYGATTLGVPVARTVVWASVGRLAVDVAHVALTADDDAFTVTDPPTRVPVLGQAASVITFRPVTAGIHRTVLQIDLLHGPPATVVLIGTGVDARGVPQLPIDFGRPAVGAIRTRPLIIANDFETPVPVTLSFIGRDAAEFSVTPSLWIAPYSHAETTMIWRPVGAAGPRHVDLRFGACPLCALETIPVSADAVPFPIVANPSPVEFGAIPVDTERRITVSLTDLTDEVFSVSSIALQTDADPGYVLTAPLVPLTLLPLVPETFVVGYSPQHLGMAPGTVVVQSDADPVSTLDVPLVATGGGAQLIVEPPEIDFKTVPVGGEGEQPVTIENGNTDPQSAPLQVTGMQISGPGFSIRQPQATDLTLAAGATALVQLVFSPTTVGPAEGTFTVSSDDPLQPTMTVSLTGQGDSTSDCQLQVIPPALNFGGVVPGQVGELGAKLANVGADVCSVWNGAVSGDVAFSLERPRPFFQLEPGDGFVAVVQYQPTAPGQAAGQLTFQTSSATQPVVTVPLTAGSSQACLQPATNDLGFGVRRLDCGPVEQNASFGNTCSMPITVTSIRLGPGTDTQTFALTGTSPLPAVLAPGASVMAQVLMQPTQVGYEIWPLFARDTTDPLPMLMSVDVTVTPPANHDEVYVQTTPGKLDLLWVLDNTASMDTDRANLIAAAPGFVQTLDSMGIDYHIGVTTTGIIPASPQNETEPCPGGANGGEAGRLFPVDGSSPRIIDPSTPDAGEVLATNMTVGGCNSVQEGLAAAELALEPPLVDNADDPAEPQPNGEGNLGFVRPDAALAIVVASNQDDQSPGTVQQNITAIEALKPTTPTTFSAIVGPVTGCPQSVQPGARYLAVVQAVGGLAESVCAADWPGMLNQLAAGLMRQRNVFPLTGPVNPATLVVKVNGVVVTDWQYDASTQSIVFDTAPAAASTIEITYDEPCP